MLTSQFKGVQALAHNGDLKPGLSGQFIGVPAKAQCGYPMSAFSNQLWGPAAPEYDDGPASIFLRQHTGVATPLNDDDAMPAALADGGYSIYPFQSQLTGLVGGYPMSRFSNQLKGTTPAPAPAFGDDEMIWRQRMQASAPAYGSDRMSMFRSQLNGAPTTKPWTRGGLLFEQMPRAYPNDGTQNAMKILDGKAQLLGCGNNGIVDNSRDQNENDVGDGSFKVVSDNVFLPPPTNLLGGQLPPLQVPPLKVLPQRLRQLPSKKGKRNYNIAWTEDEQRLFLRGLKNCASGDWKRISREYVKTKTPTQVASHAQKYFIRLKDKAEGRLTGKRKSIHDITLD